MFCLNCNFFVLPLTPAAQKGWFTRTDCIRSALHLRAAQFPRRLTVSPSRRSQKSSRTGARGGRASRQLSTQGLGRQGG